MSNILSWPIINRPVPKPRPSEHQFVIEADGYLRATCTCGFKTVKFNDDELAAAMTGHLRTITGGNNRE